MRVVYIVPLPTLLLSSPLSSIPESFRSSHLLLLFFQPFKGVPFDFFVFYSSYSFFIAAAVHCLIVLL